MLWGTHARTSRETGQTVENLRRAAPKSEEIFFLKIKTLFHALITGCVITDRVGGIVRQAVRCFYFPRSVVRATTLRVSDGTDTMFYYLSGTADGTTMVRTYDINIIYDDVRTVFERTR